MGSWHKTNLLRELQHKNQELAKEMHKTTSSKHPQLLHALPLQSLQELSCNTVQLQHKKLLAAASKGNHTYSGVDTTHSTCGGTRSQTHKVRACFGLHVSVAHILCAATVSCAAFSTFGLQQQLLPARTKCAATSQPGLRCTANPDQKNCCRGAATAAARASQPKLEFTVYQQPCLASNKGALPSESCLLAA